VATVDGSGQTGAVEGLGSGIGGGIGKLASGLGNALGSVTDGLGRLADGALKAAATAGPIGIGLVVLVVLGGLVLVARR
jgi:hypothetical protein